MDDIKTQKNLIGSAFLVKIREAMKARNLNTAETAGILGISKPYLSALFYGYRPVSGLPDKTFSNAATFLGIPKAQVLILAERLTPSDLVHSFSVDQQVEGAAKRMREDPAWMTFAPTPEEFAAMPEKLRMCFAFLYEEVSHQRFVKAIQPIKFQEALAA